MARPVCVRDERLLCCTSCFRHSPRTAVCALSAGGSTGSRTSSRRWHPRSSDMQRCLPGQQQRPAFSAEAPSRTRLSAGRRQRHACVGLLATFRGPRVPAIGRRQADRLGTRWRSRGQSGPPAPCGSASPRDGRQPPGFPGPRSGPEARTDAGGRGRGRRWAGGAKRRIGRPQNHPSERIRAAAAGTRANRARPAATPLAPLVLAAWYVCELSAIFTPCTQSV